MLAQGSRDLKLLLTHSRKVIIPFYAYEERVM